MSPRRSDPSIRSTLIDIATGLLVAEGPQALSTRSVAAAAGSSTMAVYTHFGGMGGLVREIVHEGFARLRRNLARVERTADPVADLALLGRVYRRTAAANAHVYAIMFGGGSIAGFSLTDDDRRRWRQTLATVADRAARCTDAGRFRPGDPGLVAHQMWVAIHGLVTLELGGYLIAPGAADLCFDAQLVGLMVGAGDAPATAARSVALSKDRLRGLPADEERISVSTSAE